MNKTNIFFPIAAISLLCASSISFTMDIIDKNENTQKLYKFFKLTKEELSNNEIRKVSPDAKFLFLRKNDGSERLFFVSQSKGDKFIKKPLNLSREITKFKFNKNGDALLYNFEDRAAFLNLKTNADKTIAHGLKPSGYDYGFFNHDKFLFLIDFDSKDITMYTSKDGCAVKSFDLTEDELRDKKFIDAKLKDFASTYSEFFNSPIGLLSKKMGDFIKAELKAFKKDVDDGTIRRVFNLATKEDIENIKNM